MAPLTIAGLNVPQALDQHVAVHATPPPNGSLVTCAARVSCVFNSSVAGDVEVIETPIGSDVTVRLTWLLCPGLLVAVAVMVIVLPIGTCDGAV